MAHAQPLSSKRRWWASALMVVGLALVGFAVFNAFGAGRDQVDLANAVRCELPITDNRSCVYTIGGTVLDVHLNRARRGPTSQDLRVELADQSTIDVHTDTLEPVSVGDWVAVEIWDGRAVSLHAGEVRFHTITFHGLWYPLILPGTAGMILSSWGVLMLQRRALWVAFLILAIASQIWGRFALHGSWGTAAWIAGFAWAVSLVAAPRHGLAGKDQEPKEKLADEPAEPDRPRMRLRRSRARRPTNAGQVIAALPRHRVLWRLVVAYLALLAAVVWLYWATPGWEEDSLPDHAGWAALLLVPGLALGWTWTWRLARWLLGSLRTPRPAAAEMLVAELRGGRWAAAIWLRVLDTDRRYQRVAWNRRLVAYVVATRSARTSIQVEIRPCPGFRRMYLVDVPGVGRLWPTSTARLSKPWNYDLQPYVRYRTRSGPHAGRTGMLASGAALLLLGILASGLAGPVGGVYLVVLVASYWLWQGGAPWSGVYSYVPKLASPHPVAD